MLGLWLSLYEKNIILHNKFVVRRKTEYFCLYAVHKNAIGNAANLHLLWHQNKKGFAPRDECKLPVLYRPLHNCNNKESDNFLFLWNKTFSIPFSILKWKLCVGYPKFLGNIVIEK